jgi:hypothetical protein
MADILVFPQGCKSLQPERCVTLFMASFVGKHKALTYNVPTWNQGIHWSRTKTTWLGFAARSIALFQCSTVVGVSR